MNNKLNLYKFKNIIHHLKVAFEMRYEIKKIETNNGITNNNNKNKYT